MSFFDKGWWIIKKYNEISEKVKNSLKKGFDSKLIYNEKYLKAKVKSYNGKNFHSNKIPKDGPQYISLSVNLLDSIFRTGRNYYTQVFLEECKYVIKEKKISRYIIDDAEISSDSDEETLLEKNQMKKNSDYQASSGEEILEKIQMEKISDEENCGKKIFFFYIHKKW